MMLMLPASIFVSILIFISSYLPPVSAACLPCKFQRPNFWQRWTLQSRDPRATPIRIFNPSYRSVWFFGEWQNATDLNLPAGASECQVYLAQWNWTTKDYRKVFLGNPLATDCNIYDGNTTVKVPKDDKFRPSNNWVIVLRTPNSDDHSTPFTIAAPPKDQ